MPSKRIIVLERIEAPTPIYRVAFWADVPSARQAFYADANKISAWSGASGAEKTDLQTGAVFERVETISVPAGFNLSQMQTLLQDRWTAFQAEVTAVNTFGRYGTFWDGTSWTSGGA